MRRILPVRLMTALSILCLYGGGFPPSATAATQSSNPAFEDSLDEANALLKKRRYEEAIKAFKKANKLVQDSSPDCYLGLAQAFSRLEAHKNVIDSVERLLRLNPGDNFRAQGLNMKGIAQVALSDNKPEKLREAVATFREGLKLDEDLAILHFNLGYTLLKLQLEPEGKQELEEYLELAPTGPFADDARRYIENPRRARESYAPEFSLTTMQGEYLSIEDLAGKVVLLDFWATWCGPCVESVPVLKRFYQKFPRDRFVLISVSVDDDESAWREFIAKKKMDWPQFLDDENDLQRKFFPGRGIALPTYMVIDAEGIIRTRVVGAGIYQNASLEDEIKKWLKASSPSTQKKGS